jgi:TRAP-type mannitol/chloroaromatic compound transport system permease small subunit
MAQAIPARVANGIQVAGAGLLNTFLLGVDRLNTGVGKAFGWCIMLLTLAVSYEVFVRYVLNAPTRWAYDTSYILYGALFLMTGAYTLSRNGHVRGDVFYRLWRPKVQAGVDLVLYFFFFFPGILALIYSGYNFAEMSFRFKEVSIFSPAGVPIYPLKALIPVAGFLLLIQGIAEVIRCVICIQTGEWPRSLHDVEEIESALENERQFLAEKERAAAGGKAS